MKKFLLSALLLIAGPLFGQVTIGFHRVNQVVARGSSGTEAVVVPNANIYVTSTATGALATIYRDPLLTIPIPTGMVTADSSGNFSYYMPLGYCVNERVQYPGSGNFTTINICSLAGAGGAIVSSINSVSGPFTFTGANVSCTGNTCTFSNTTGAEIQTNDVDNALQTILNFKDTATVKFTNPSGGIESATVPNATNSSKGAAQCDGTTTNCVAGVISANPSVNLQTDEIDNTSQVLLDFQDSPTVRFRNPSGGIETADVDVTSGIGQFIQPPISGQYVILTPTGFSKTDAPAVTVTGDLTSADMASGSYCSFGSSGTATWTFTGALEAQYPDLAASPGRITAVYAAAVGANHGILPVADGCLSASTYNVAAFSATATATGATGGSLFPISSEEFESVPATGQLVSLTGANVDTTQVHTSIAMSGDFRGASDTTVNGVRLFLYYTGSPVSSPGFIPVNVPLLYSATEGLSIDPNANFWGKGLQSRWIQELPPATSWPYAIIAVDNAVDALDCAAGTGSTSHLCQSNGTAWVPYGSGGSGSPTVGTAGQMQMVGSTAGSHAASACTDNGTTVACSEAVTAPSLTAGTVSPAADAALPSGAHGFSCDESSTAGVPAAGVDYIRCDAVTHQLVHSENGVAEAPFGGGGGGGITSINSQTGPAVTIHSSDASVTVSTTTNDIDLTTAGGSSGVQYNPITTAYVVTSFSGLYDDANAQNSRSLGVPSSVSCVHTSTSTCTVTYGSAHSLSIGDAVDMSNLASWPAGIIGSVQQAAQYGSFQVTTVPSSTQITFTTPTTLTYTCSPCTGTTYDASLWGIWQFGKQSYIYGHGTIYGFETTTQAAAANLATWVASISASPMFLIDQTGQNDFLGGRSSTQVEADKQTLWAAAHTAGMKVLETTIVPAQYGLTGADVKPGQVNYFMWTQYMGKNATMVSNGQYIDYYADTARALLHVADNTPSLPDPHADVIWAQTVNEAFAAKGGLPIQPADTFSYSASGLGADVQSVYAPAARLWFDSNWFNFMAWQANAGGFLGMDIYSHSTTGGPPTLIREWNSTLASGDWFGDCLGRDTGNNNAFCHGFNYTSSTSTNNYYMVRPYGGSTDVFRAYASGEFTIPSIATSASPNPACFNGTHGGLTNIGCTGGGGSGTVNSGTANQIAYYAGTGTAVSGTNAIPNGTTATTQSPADNSTKVATTAYVDAAVVGGTRQWSCQPGLGDGLNAITAGTYLQSTCKNTTGSTVTLTGLQCFTDNSGTSTMNAAGNTLGALLTGAVTCTSSFATASQSGNVALTNGDYIKFTFVADGTSKQATWVVQGTY